MPDAASAPSVDRARTLANISICALQFNQFKRVSAKNVRRTKWLRFHGSIQKLKAFPPGRGSLQRIHPFQKNRRRVLQALHPCSMRSGRQLWTCIQQGPRLGSGLIEAVFRVEKRFLQVLDCGSELISVFAAVWRDAQQAMRPPHFGQQAENVRAARGLKRQNPPSQPVTCAVFKFYIQSKNSLHNLALSLAANHGGILNQSFGQAVVPGDPISAWYFWPGLKRDAHDISLGLFSRIYISIFASYFSSHCLVFS